MAAMAQVSGEFYLEKTTFAPGEPVFLYFKLSNNGPDAVEVVDPDPEQPFCSGVSMKVSKDPADPSTCPIWADHGCSIDGQLLLSPLLPGKSRIDRYLLNFHHDIRTAGAYWVEATHFDIPGRAVGEVHAKLYFHVDGDVPAFAPSNVHLWVDQLQSTDQEKRLEAARTLASLAPPSLEAILLSFADNPEFLRYAPLAFHRLHSPRSMKAMADLMKASGPGTFEHMEAARYLAESNDLEWYPLLLDAAQKNPGISAYPAYAAELGGAQMIPVLVDLAKSPDSRLQAVMAMGSTGSPAAIPILLELLKSPDEAISDRASYSLRLLTHRTAVRDPRNRDRRAEYVKWSRWWRGEGTTAPIFKDTECGEPVPLP
ncbi:MAG TPA: HEAT repeat domain-containing protein [Terriglobales bacterium]|nr:HEAT repeat domain-containing protein [Terriglobales bacterium]